MRMPTRSLRTFTMRFTRKTAKGRDKFRVPRIEMSRLTVRQYRNAVADLIGSFRGGGQWGEERGLKAEYSSRGRRRREGNSGGSLNRVDPEIHFDFGTDSPIPEQNALKELAKTWQRVPLLLVPFDHSGRFPRNSGSTGKGLCWRRKPASTNSHSRRKMPAGCSSMTRTGR